MSWTEWSDYKDVVSVCVWHICEGYQKSSFALRGYSMKKNEVMWSVKWLSAFFCIANIRCSMIVGNYRLPTSGHDPPVGHKLIACHSKVIKLMLSIPFSFSSQYEKSIWLYMARTFISIHGSKRWKCQRSDAHSWAVLWRAVSTN